MGSLLFRPLSNISSLHRDDVCWLVPPTTPPVVCCLTIRAVSVPSRNFIGYFKDLSCPMVMIFADKHLHLNSTSIKERALVGTFSGTVKFREGLLKALLTIWTSSPTPPPQFLYKLKLVLYIVCAAAVAGSRFSRNFCVQSLNVLK